MTANSTHVESQFAGFPPSGHTNCPMCDYPLTGLPAAHTCPECGFQYDAETRVWVGEPHRFSKLNALFYLACIPFWLSTAIRAFLSRSRMSDLIKILAVITLLATPLLEVYWRRRSRRLPPLAAITSKGIIHRAGGRSAKLLPWRELDSVNLKPASAKYVISLVRSNGRPKRLTSPFRTTYDTLAFAEIAVARMNREGNLA